MKYLRLDGIRSVVNIQRENKTIKNLFKFLLAVMVLVFLWAFFNDSTYNVIKKQFVKNADKYIEMYAYSKSKPAFFEKYFIIQENKQAESFFRKEVKTINEKDVTNINCVNEEIILLYERPDPKISEFVQKRGGEELIINQGTNIEFIAARIKKPAESCNVGG